MASADDDKDEKGSTVRSPKYPALSLSDAIEKVRMLYDKDKTAGSPMDAAVRHMGYKSRSGPANTTIAALRRYGLVDSVGGRLIPTKRAVAILVLPDTDERRKEALRDAALSPGLYKRLFEEYQQSGNLPSAESLEQELMLGGQFNHNSVKPLVKDFISSLFFAGLTTPNGVILFDGRQANDGEVDDEKSVGGESAKKSRLKGPDMVAPGMKQDVYTLDEGDVVFVWPARLSHESIQDVEDWLALLLRKLKRSAVKPDETDDS